jgi:hypothetical protein
MRAFNKRFRPTLHFGAFTITTLALGLLGALMLVFAVGALVQVKNGAAAVLFFMFGLASIGGAVRDHLNLPRKRLQGSILRGKADRRKKRLELNG